MTFLGRAIFFLSGIALFCILFFPLWQIQLSAPQYPEGLVLLIFPNKLGGNVDIINGLNHYIGMKPLHASDFVEFTVLPYIISFFSLLFIFAGMIGKRKWMRLSFLLILIFGIIAMADFWVWEYNYGHNLNPDAAIVVPGMSYDPPLIGFKQLLNFGAYSIPDIGAWIFVGVGLAALFVIIADWRKAKKEKSLSKMAFAMAAPMVILFCSACNAKPEPLVLGKDKCSFCTMTISDPRFGAEIISEKGKIFKFDDPDCALSFLKSAETKPPEIKAIYFTDFVNDHSLIASENAIFLKSESLKAPMGGNLAAFSNQEGMNEVLKEYSGSVLHWGEIYKP